MQVSNPTELYLCSFDLLIIASFDPALKAEVEGLFKEQCLDPKKIRTVSIDTSNLAQFVTSTGYDPITFLPFH
jgi:hypothetical protein